MEELNTCFLLDLHGDGTPFATALHSGQPITGDMILLTTAMGTTKYEIMQVQVPLIGASTDPTVETLDLSNVKRTDPYRNTTFFAVVEEFHGARE